MNQPSQAAVAVAAAAHRACSRASRTRLVRMLASDLSGRPDLNRRPLDPQNGE